MSKEDIAGLDDLVHNQDLQRSPSDSSRSSTNDTVSKETQEKLSSCSHLPYLDDTPPRQSTSSDVFEDCLDDDPVQSNNSSRNTNSNITRDRKLHRPPSPVVDDDLDVIVESLALASPTAETRTTQFSLAEHRQESTDSGVSELRSLDSKPVSFELHPHLAPTALPQDIYELSPEDHERAKRSSEYEHSIEDPIEIDMFRDNAISIQGVDLKAIQQNTLGPREQEEVDAPVCEGMYYLFDNKFMQAKAIFQSKANVDPLYSLGLGAMAFIKAMMTFNNKDVEIATGTLATAYSIAKAQIKNAPYKRPFKDSVSYYLSTVLNRNTSGLPSNTAPATQSGYPGEGPTFLPNGILRAHVIKAECCLLISILQLSQESIMGYVRCGINIRRAYNSYSIVWQEYKRMGQQFTKHMDRDTVSAIQFGIGAVHLLLSSMPAKILKILSTLGFQSNRQLGFALLKLCVEGGGIRAPLASLTLLSYYSILTSFAPQIYAKDLVSSAIECLMNAQRKHPSSCFFLFFAARISRVARNLPLSNQSFTFAAESSQGEWAEVAMRQMSDYEIGFNLALQLDWEGAATYFEQLCEEGYWSPAFSKYFVGACREMLGQRTEGILAFAEVPTLVKEKQARTTYVDAHVLKKVSFFQRSGYQDMDLSLPGLEILLVWNAFVQMEPDALENCMILVERTLERIYEREKLEYSIRVKELVPDTTPPDYYDQRAVLLLTKAAILNALERYHDTIAHLNWIMDHKEYIKHETWVVPFTYWEAGVTSWGLGDLRKSRKLWQMALTCTKYDFEYRMAVRLSLALAKCDETGIRVRDEQIKGMTSHGRKRMPIKDPC